MSRKKLKILQGLSEVAGQNSYAVLGLRSIGEDAETVIYYRHPFDYAFDKCLNINKGKKIAYPLYAAKLFCFFISALAKYNVFHFHFGHSILNNFDLPFYKLFNKKVFFEFHGSDLRDYRRYCELTGTPYEPENETLPKLHRRNEVICKNADGIILHDDELIKYLPEKCSPVYVVPLRMDVEKFDVVYPSDSNESIRIVHAPSSRAGKGTKYVLEAFEELKKVYDNIELVLVEGKTQKEAFEIYKTADIIVDQLFTGTYGVFAVESMSMGKPVITCISKEMEELLPEDLPIVSANIYSIKDKLELLINDSKLRHDIGVKSREYTENYHDYRAIAYILKDIYEGVAEPKNGRAAFEQVKTIKNEKFR